MAQVKSRKEFNLETSAAEILQLVASAPASLESVPRLLQILLNETGASGATFISFSGIVNSISIGDSDALEGHESSLYESINKLPEQANINPDITDKTILHHKGWLVFPFRHEGQTISALWLTFPSKHTPSNEENQLIATVGAGLKILTGRASNSARIPNYILNSITDPVVGWDENSNLILFNSAAETLFDISSKDVLGYPLSAVIKSPDLLTFITESKPIPEWNLDNRAFIPRVETVPDSGGFLILEDISRYKKLTRNQGEFMRIVSHDLRSPLTSMQGFTSMMEMAGQLNEKQTHFVGKILSGIEQLTGLVENIQDAGRYDPESGFYELNRSHCDLDEMAHRLVENPLIPADKTLSLSVNIANNVPIIYADQNMIERAMRNLVDNAIKYTPSGGEIDLSITVENNSVLFAVRDNGLGISEEDQKHLFQRHVRIARQEHKKIKGSGLGLFIVRSVAQRHGGDAWVKSKLGEGATFYFNIPLNDANLIGASDQ